MRIITGLVAIALLLVLPEGRAARAAAPPLQLDQALRQAHALQPSLAGARANLAAAEGSLLQSRAALLPTLAGSANYQRTTVNFVPRPGYVIGSPSAVASPRISGASDDFWSLAIGAQWLVYDFQVSIDKWRAARLGVASLTETQRATQLSVDYAVRSAFFQAITQRSLVDVARRTLDNQRKHCAQTVGYIAAGTQPSIALAQSRTDVANAKVTLIGAENDYANAKLALNQAMGVSGDAAYEVAHVEMPEVERTFGAAGWLSEAQGSRPDLQALLRSQQAAERSAAAVRGNYFPSLSVGANFSDQGSQLSQLAWNWNVQGTLNWNFFSGGLTYGQALVADANLQAVQAQIATLRLQVRLDVQQALQGIDSGVATLAAADEALENAEQLLAAAEGRYAAGAGSIIELGDAQVAQTHAAAQRVVATYQLSTARAGLLKAAGRV